MHLSLGELHAILGGQLRQGAMPPRDGEHSAIGRIVTDARAVRSGDVFWALDSSEFNGPHFAEEAFARGATGVVTSRRWAAPWAGCWSLEVEDAQTALSQLAHWHRQRLAGSVIAIAGSIGKTTTRSMIDAVLAQRLVGAAQEASSLAAIPEAVVQIASDEDYHLLEVQRNGHGGEQAARVLRPHLCVITQLDDGNNFARGSSAYDVAHALLTSLPESGCAILNGDDPHVRRLAMATRARVIFVGRDGDCTLVATHVQSRNGLLKFNVAGHRLQVPVWGRHHLTNALAAVAVGRELGLSWSDIAAGLAGLPPAGTHSNVSDDAGAMIIDDTQTTSPAAARAALSLLGEADVCGRRIVVCSDVSHESESAEWPRLFGEEAVTRSGADFVVAYGNEAFDVVDAAREAGLRHDRAVECSDEDEALPCILSFVRPGDAVLLEGSPQSAAGGMGSVRSSLHEHLRRRAA